MPKLKSDDIPIGFIGASPIFEWPQERLVSREYLMGEAFLKQLLEQILVFINFTLDSLRKCFKEIFCLNLERSASHRGDC